MMWWLWQKAWADAVSQFIGDTPQNSPAKTCQCATAAPKTETVEIVEAPADPEALSGISHDLRTPLNAIIGFTEIMQAGTFGKITSERYEDYLRHIQKSGYELLSKIEDLLAAPRSEAAATMAAMSAAPLHDDAEILDFAGTA